MNRILHRKGKNDTWNREGKEDRRLHIMLHDALCNVVLM